jgi:hypothetical protein
MASTLIGRPALALVTVVLGAQVGLPDELPQLLADADVVMVCAPLTPATQGLFNAAMFARMKRDAMFVNWSRADIVVPDDLAAALKAGTIGSAALNWATDAREHAPLRQRRKDVLGVRREARLLSAHRELDLNRLATIITTPSTTSRWMAPKVIFTASHSTSHSTMIATPRILRIPIVISRPDSGCKVVAGRRLT